MLHGHLDQAVAALGACFGDQGQIRRSLAVIGGSSSLGVRERVRQRIGKTPRTGEHLTFVVGAVLDLVLRCQGLGLGFRVSDLLQVAELDQIHGMTGGTDVLVDQISALGGGPVKGAEKALEGPILSCRLGGCTRGLGRGCPQRHGGNGCSGDDGREGGLDVCFHHVPYSAGCVTEAEMLSGTAFGRSITPRMGRITKRWAK